MSKRHCHHINPAGVFCGGEPVRKRDYCFWHLHETGRRMKAARARARSERVIIKLPVLDDLHSVQAGLMQLGEAIAHGELEYQTGRLMLGVLRLAASNIKSLHGWHQKTRFQVTGVDSLVVVEDGGFEEDYDLPKNFDLGVPPEEAFPPPLPTVAAATQTQSKPASGTPPASAGGAARRRPPRSDHSPAQPQQEQTGAPTAKSKGNPATAPAANALSSNRKPPQPDSATAAAQASATRKSSS